MLSPNTVPETIDPGVDTLVTLFDKTFFATFNTRLVVGNDEPNYLPSGRGESYAQIVFAHGYFASALHEIAHWCIAGEARRQLEDYGYWYCPDGRNADEQAAFEKVEVKPQAVEMALTLAANRQFRVSTDNLNGVEPDREHFTGLVNEQFARYQKMGFPPRAEQFITALQAEFGGPCIQSIDVREVA